MSSSLEFLIAGINNHLSFGERVECLSEAFRKATDYGPAINLLEYFYKKYVDDVGGPGKLLTYCRNKKSSSSCDIGIICTNEDGQLHVHKNVYPSRITYTRHVPHICEYHHNGNLILKIEFGSLGGIRAMYGYLGGNLFIATRVRNNKIVSVAFNNIIHIINNP
jgi:hypothetical protein